MNSKFVQAMSNIVGFIDQSYVSYSYLSQFYDDYD